MKSLPRAWMLFERVGRGDAGFHRDQHATVAAFDLAFERRVFAEEMAHDAFAARHVHEIVSKPIRPRVGMIASTETRCGMVIHVDDLRLSAGDRLQDVAEVFVRHIDVKILDRLEQVAIVRLGEKSLPAAKPSLRSPRGASARRGSRSAFRRAR